MTRLASMAAGDPTLAATIESLSKVGVKTGEDLFWLIGCGTNLANQASVSQEDLEALLDSITQCYSCTPRMASEVYCSWKEHVSILSTGCDSLDEALGKGLFTDEITELVGASSSGKTQICLSMAVWTAQNQSTVAYIDSGGSLMPTRLQEIHLKRGGQDEGRYRVLNNVRQLYARDVEGLFGCLGEIEQGLIEAAGEFSNDPYWKKLRLVVVDSIGSLFAPVIGASGQVAHSQLVSATHTMQRIATQHHVAFLVCNHTTGKPSSTGEPDQAALGQTWQFLPCVSVHLSRVNDEVRCARVRKSNKAKVGATVNFKITSKGVVDDE